MLALNTSLAKQKLVREKYGMTNRSVHVTWAHQRRKRGSRARLRVHRYDARNGLAVDVLVAWHRGLHGLGVKPWLVI